MSWKSFLKDYFNFSRAERYGILGLCGCIMLMLTINWAMSFRMKPEFPDTTAFADEIAQFRLAVDAETIANNQTETPLYIQTVAELFYFDPNSATDKEWDRLGLNERQITNIRNYMAAGGTFRRKEDLQKLYTISATLYKLLEPYIRIAAIPQSARQSMPEMSANLVAEKTESGTASPQYTKLEIELNMADSSLLTQLPGIGPVLAARTVRYRNLIGGFVDMTQLGEVYGINQELVERLSTQISVDSLLVRKIPVNTATFGALVSHPYINEQQARGIMNYRRLQNRVNSLDELVRNNILERETAEKIRPYLSFE